VARHSCPGRVTSQYGASVKRNQLPSHFLGAIVLEPLSVGLREVQALGVIDGQQRLTTLQVFLAAFRDLVRSLDETFHGELLKATQNSGLKSKPEEAYKVWPTNFDREAFKLVLDAGSPDGVRHLEEEARNNWDSVPQLVQAYLYFSDELVTWLGVNDGTEEDEQLDRATALFYALRDSLQLVAIRLEDGDDPQVIFETLNARGVPLLASDLIRNFVFSAASRDELAVDQLYERYWRDFDGDATTGRTYWRESERVGRERRSRLVLFFYHFLTYKLARDLTFAHVFEAFRAWWNSRTGTSVEDGLKEIVEASNAYRRIINPSSDDRFGVFAHRLQALDITTLHPLLLYLQLEAKVSETDLARIVSDLESYLIRRTVCGLAVKNYNRFFLQLIIHLSEGASNPADAVREFLAAGEGDSVRWPDDAEFGKEWLRRPVYRRARSAVGTILQAVDASMTTGLQEALHLRETPTIEHVMPRNWQEHWPPPDESLGTAEETAQDVRNRLIHTFGNLTLLTTRLNSKVRNGSYTVKRPEIAEQSSLRMNTFFQNQMTWDESVIHERGKDLLLQALQVWPHPRRRASEIDWATARVAGTEGHMKSIDPSAVLGETAQLLLESLPTPLTVRDKSDRNYVRVLHARWPGQVHYELRHRSGAYFAEIHFEFGKGSAEHKSATGLIEELKTRLQDHQTDGEYQERGSEWTWLGVQLPLATSPMDLVESLREVVMLTRDPVEDYFSYALEDEEAA
jgi:hypothetical protein